MIPFRKQRIATSVVNRILNLADEILPPKPSGQVAAPGPIPGNEELTAALNTPPQPATAPPETAEQVALTQGRLF